MPANTDVQIVEILVIGLPGTGKSTLMHTISQRTAFRGGNPADWQMGYLVLDESLHVRFLEPPQSSVFDFIYLRDVIAATEAPGIMIVCDSTEPDYFGENIAIMQTILAYQPDIPQMLVANKQDQDNAWTVEDIRMGLGIPDEILVEPCVASDIHQVKEVVLQLLYRIFGV